MLPGLIKATAGMDCCSSKFITGCMCEWRLFFGPGWPFWTASFLLLMGSLFVSWQLAKLLGVLLSLFVLPGKPLRSFGPKGSWAVVTGASDGLGKEFALQLASADFNVVLVSRTASKLEALAEEIASKHPSAQTKIVVMDYAQNKDSDFEHLKSVIAPLDVAVLINNVGKSHDIPVPFALTSHEEMTDIVNINCHGTLRTTQLVIPGMAQRRRGLILTMGSFGGLTPNPLLATYSGSKAFLQQWSTSLGAELEPFGITVELIQAYLITSAMSKIRRTSMFIPNPRTFVKSVLSKITRHGGSPSYAFSSSPYWSHGLMAYFLTCVIGTNSKFLAEINMESHQETRNRALRKAEREKGKKLT